MAFYFFSILIHYQNYPTGTVCLLQTLKFMLYLQNICASVFTYFFVSNISYGSKNLSLHRTQL